MMKVNFLSNVVHYLLCGLQVQILVLHLAILVYWTNQVFMLYFKFFPVVPISVVCYFTLIWSSKVSTIYSDVYSTTIRIVVSSSALTLIVYLGVFSISLASLIIIIYLFSIIVSLRFIYYICFISSIYLFSSLSISFT